MCEVYYFISMLMLIKNIKVNVYMFLEFPLYSLGDVRNVNFKIRFIFSDLLLTCSNGATDSLVSLGPNSFSEQAGLSLQEGHCNAV